MRVALDFPLLLVFVAVHRSSSEGGERTFSVSSAEPPSLSAAEALVGEETGEPTVDVAALPPKPCLFATKPEPASDELQLLLTRC